MLDRLLDEGGAATICEMLELLFWRMRRSAKIEFLRMDASLRFFRLALPRYQPDAHEIQRAHFGQCKLVC